MGSAFNKTNGANASEGKLLQLTGCFVRQFIIHGRCDISFVHEFLLFSLKRGGGLYVNVC